MAADNNLNPYAIYTNFRDILTSIQHLNHWPIALQIHSPPGATHDKGSIFTAIFTDDDTEDLITEEDGVNTGDPKILTKFLSSTMNTLQCDQLFLILWGHGTGSLDIENQAELDKSSIVSHMHSWINGQFGGKSYGHDDTDSDALTTDELRAALAKALKGKRLDLLGFDACLMATIETVTETAGHCKIYIGSETTIPNIGWPYKAILESMFTDDITYPEQVAEIICRNYPLNFNKEKKVCLSAIQTDELMKIMPLLSELNTVLISLMSNSNYFMHFTKALQDTTQFWFMFYDLYSLITNIKNRFGDSSKVVEIAEKICNILDKSIIYNVSQGFNEHDVVKGLSILFPSKPLSNDLANRYAQLSFCKKTKWNSLINKYYE